MSSSVAEALQAAINKNKINRTKIKDIQDGYDEFLNDWERKFLASVDGWLSRSSSNSLSQKQQAILDDMEKNLLERMN